MSHQSGACDNRALELEGILRLHWKPSRDRSSIARIIYPHPTCKRQNAPYAKVVCKHLHSPTGQFLLPACDLLRYNPVQFSGARPLRLYAPSLKRQLRRALSRAYREGAAAARWHQYGDFRSHRGARARQIPDRSCYPAARRFHGVPGAQDGKGSFPRRSETKWNSGTSDSSGECFRNRHRGKS
jgi:hypothetical protein